MNPQTLNPYVYCLNNPLKYIDPDGRRPSRYDFSERDAPSRIDIFFLVGLATLVVTAGGICSGNVWITAAGIGGRGASMIVGDYQSDSERLWEEANEWIEKHHEYDVEEYRIDPKYDEYGYLDFFLITITLKDGTKRILKIEHTFWGWEVDEDSLDVPEEESTSSGYGSAPYSDEEDSGSLGGGDDVHDWIPI